MSKKNFDKKIVIDDDIKEKVKSSFSLTLLFTFVVFVVLLVSVLIAAVVVYILSINYVKPFQIENLSDIGNELLFMAVVSLVVGMGIAFGMSRFPLKPINRMITQINRLAKGDFKARIHFNKPLSSHPAFFEVENSFNKMAEELENTEMLRSDFINNFSHEFKTPIVSISGFAKLLKRGDLTEEQKKEYLDAIEEESLRLSYMATNVLNLTKIENQSILTDVSEYNLSEQVRSALLLLENKWSRRKLELDIDFPEIKIYANEELLKQVWINLIDNAIKFSPEYGILKIEMTENIDAIRVDICNFGEIPKDAEKRIWNKFYQADESHSSEGNGIGLAVVKRIIELHNGTISQKCENGIVTFSVTLPNKQ